MDYNAAFYILTIISAIGGVAIFLKLIFEKRKAKPVFCPFNGHCDAVVRGEYAKTFGISNEYLGIVYYLGIIVSYLLFLFIPAFVGTAYHLLVIIGSCGAFIFSLYLTYLQAFVIKRWCTYCVGSAFLTVLIMVFVLLGGGYDILVQIFFV